MPDEHRHRARELARAALGRNEPTSWFEELYASAEAPQAIPWADLEPNPSLVAWARREQLDGRGRRALDVGCGLGDDAEALAALGFDVVAFDISPTAIAWARRRFPDSSVGYETADLLALPEGWSRSFDFVLEAYTLQVLPASLRATAAAAIADTVAPGGLLLVIARGREADEPVGAMPWPLTEAELRALFGPPLEPIGFEDFVDSEDPPVRRFRALFRRA